MEKKLSSIALLNKNSLNLGLGQPGHMTRERASSTVHKEKGNLNEVPATSLLVGKIQCGMEVFL